MEKALDCKIEDYSRFTIVLLILSTYLYAGVLIQIFAKHSVEHLTFIFSLLAGCLIAAFVFAILINQLRKQQ